MDDITFVEEPSPASRELRGFVDYLSFLSRRLATLSLFAALFTLIHIILPVFVTLTAVRSLSFYPGPFSVAGVFIWIDMVTLVICVVILFLFERTTARGNLVYQEVSDTAEWIDKDKQVDLEMRVAMRRFVLETKLPLVGVPQSGPLLYAIVNFTASFLVWIIIAVRF